MQGLETIIHLGLRPYFYQLQGSRSVCVPELWPPWVEKGISLSSSTFNYRRVYMGVVWYVAILIAPTSD